MEALPLVASTDTVTDSMWARLKGEAIEAARREPELASLLHLTVLGQPNLGAVVVGRIAERLETAYFSRDVIRTTYQDALRAAPSIADAIRADLAAVLERDPATSRLLEPALYYKGFHALQTHRLAHWLWTEGRRDFALMLQSRSSEVFQADIHPAVPMGRGVFLDHATGLVVGETAVIEDNVSMLQGVTLGGTGKETGDRHPKIRRGVLIGAGAKILGSIEVGRCARIGAGSIVLQSVPPGTTVAGVPARVIGQAGCPEPSRMMNHMLYDVGL